MQKWNYYTTNELKPSGWLARQLRIQADGLNGNLDKIWPDVRDSKWIGGDKTTAPGGIWGERVPYWLDGFIPLAYLLEDEDMISRAKQYIATIVSRQKEDGWICPCEKDERSSFDPWIILLMAKMLVVYYQCSNDEEILNVVYRILKNYYDQLKSGALKLQGWGQYRWFEGLISVNFLYERTGEEWLCDLAKILYEQGTDYTKVTEHWKRPLNKWQWETHIVNMTMLLKYEAVTYGILGKEYTDNAQKLLDILNTYHNTAIGLITGDECLAGISPIHGTELCSVVEQLFSYENLYAYTGDRKWIDRMESIAFNALPAALDEKMQTHQYLQLANQMTTKRFGGNPPFRTNPDGAHLFAFDRIWGCCTSNFGQGWPKFALSAFAHDGKNAVISLFSVPSELTTDRQHIKLTTNYPFEHSMHYEIEAKDAFTFKIRIPEFVEKLFVNGTETTCSEELVYDLKAGEHKTIELRYETAPKFVSRPYDLSTVQWGPLFFSVPIKYDVIRRELEEPYFETEYHPTSDWNYAYCEPTLELEHHEMPEIPFSSQAPAVTIKAYAKKIDWGYAEGFDSLCAKVPESREPISEKEELHLFPYGCAKLRMTEIPRI